MYSISPLLLAKSPSVYGNLTYSYTNFTCYLPNIDCKLTTSCSPNHIQLLRPFIMGAKRSLQLALGVEASSSRVTGEEEEEGVDVEEGLEVLSVEHISCEVCGRLFQHLGAMKSHRKACTGEIMYTPEAAEGEDSALRNASSSAELGAGGAGEGGDSAARPLFERVLSEGEIFGVLPQSDLDADSIAEFDWLEATLQPHQVIGVNWLLRAYSNGINCILADEMGLGKTIQTIAFLGMLKFTCGVVGPSLIVAPLSVLTTWVNEFKRFAPAMRVVRLVHDTLKCKLCLPAPRPSPSQAHPSLTSCYSIRLFVFCAPLRLCSLLLPCRSTRLGPSSWHCHNGALLRPDGWAQVRLHSGDREERELMRTELLSDVTNFDVVVTTYEMASSQARPSSHPLASECSHSSEIPAVQCVKTTPRIVPFPLA